MSDIYAHFSTQIMAVRPRPYTWFLGFYHDLTLLQPGPGPIIHYTEMSTGHNGCKPAMVVGPAPQSYLYYFLCCKILHYNPYRFMGAALSNKRVISLIMTPLLCYWKPITKVLLWQWQDWLPVSRATLRPLCALFYADGANITPLKWIKAYSLRELTPLHKYTVLPKTYVQHNEGGISRLNPFSAGNRNLHTKHFRFPVQLKDLQLLKVLHINTSISSLSLGASFHATYVFDIVR